MSRDYPGRRRGMRSAVGAATAGTPSRALVAALVATVLLALTAPSGAAAAEQHAYAAAMKAKNDRSSITPANTF